MKAHFSQSYTLASRSKSRRSDQNLPKSMPAPTHGGQDIAAKLIEKLTKDINGQLLTSGIKHWGLGGYTSVLPRIKVRCRVIVT